MSGHATGKGAGLPCAAPIVGDKVQTVKEDESMRAQSFCSLHSRLTAAEEAVLAVRQSAC